MQPSEGGLHQRVPFRTHSAQDKSVEQPWTLAAGEFIRRFLLHAAPEGFTPSATSSTQLPDPAPDFLKVDATVHNAVHKHDSLIFWRPTPRCRFRATSYCSFGRVAAKTETDGATKAGQDGITLVTHGMLGGAFIALGATFSNIALTDACAILSSGVAVGFSLLLVVSADRAPGRPRSS